MRSGRLSLIATSSLAALLGCPLQNLADNSQAASGTDAAANGASAGFANSERHDDAVDGKGDVSWASVGELGSGASALRVLMTDAPIEADSVFVTFCGIHVQSLGAPAHTGSGARDPGDAPRGDDGRAPPRGERTPAGEAGAPGAAGRAGAADRPADGGAGGSSGDDEHALPAEGEGDEAMPAAAGIDGESTEAERAEAERVEAERVEAERAEAERAEADFPEGERPEGERADGVGADVAEGDRSDGQPERAPVGNWLAVSEQCQTLDLLTLRDGVTEAVGVATLPPGRYGQIRLMLVDASIVVDGVEQPLTIPSGSESGLKIGGGFALFEGAATTITLDFDAGRSIRFAPGNGFMMSPVIELIDVTTHDGAQSVSDGRSARPPSDPARGGAGGSMGSPDPAAPRTESGPRGDATPRPEPTSPEAPGASAPEGEARTEPPPPPDAPAPEAPASDEEAGEPSAADAQ